MPEPDEEPLQIILTRLLDLAALDMDVLEREFFCAASFPRSKPSERTLAVSSSAVSSNIMNTPGSPNCVAPRTRNSMARRVLPAPALPQTSVGRPAGNPPPVISSRPWMPVGDLGSLAPWEALFFFKVVGSKVTADQPWLPWVGDDKAASGRIPFSPPLALADTLLQLPTIRERECGLGCSESPRPFADVRRPRSRLSRRTPGIFGSTAALP